MHARLTSSLNSDNPLVVIHTSSQLVAIKGHHHSLWDGRLKIMTKLKTYHETYRNGMPHKTELKRIAELSKNARLMKIYFTEKNICLTEPIHFGIEHMHHVTELKIYIMEFNTYTKRTPFKMMRRNKKK